MNLISEIISTLTTKEINTFIKNLDLKNKSSNSANINLLKGIIHKKEGEIREKLGGNAFNVAVKRLTDRLLDFTAHTIIEKDVANEIEVLKLILVARKLFQHGKFNNAFKVIGKSEKKAIELADYSLLNEIYHTYIQYSQHELSPEQKDIFSKFEANQIHFLEQERVNMVYAVVQKSFKGESNNLEPLDIGTLISNTFTNFGISDERAYNMKSLYQLAEIIDIDGASSKSYSNVDLFFIDKLKKIKGSVLDNEKHLIYHIDLLYSIANIYFRQRNFEKSLSFLDEMQEQMIRYDSKLFHSREIQFTTLKALVHNYSNDYKYSETILDKLIGDKKHHTDDLNNPLLTRLIIHFQQNEFKQANSILSRFNRSDQWYKKKIGIEWLLNKKYVEILLHIELEHFDYVESKIQSLERSHNAYFKTNSSFQTLPFLRLIKDYCNDPYNVTSSEFNKKVTKKLNWETVQQKDVFLISFYAWLKSKMIKKPLYEVTLELINN
jgi:hypothetical protein